MKTKNPLYVVKGKEVQEASSVLDLVIKKFNLEPMIQILQNILRMLMEQVKTWDTFIAVKNFMDEIIINYFAIVKRFGLA